MCLCAFPFSCPAIEWATFCPQCSTERSSLLGFSKDLPVPGVYLREQLHVKQGEKVAVPTLALHWYTMKRLMLRKA